ncbi:MAG TPA: hypothetical protein VFW11_17580 [Cyclobacteriaceae bacterium]|nr:hypothetical protein [Cyclobacteriaceae bacterium]
MRRASIGYFLTLFFLLSSGYGQLTAHTCKDCSSNSFKERLSGLTSFAPSLGNHTSVVDSSSKSNKDRKGNDATDIEEAEEWVTGRKYLESINCSVTPFYDLVPPSVLPGINPRLSLDHHFFYFSSSRSLYLLFRLIRI